MIKRVALLLLATRIRVKPNEDADTIAKFCIKYGIKNEGFERIVSHLSEFEVFEPKERIITLVTAACILSGNNWRRLSEIMLDPRIYKYDLIAARYILLCEIVCKGDKEEVQKIFEKAMKLSEQIVYPPDETLYTRDLNETYFDLAKDKLAEKDT